MQQAVSLCFNPNAAKKSRNGGKPSSVGGNALPPHAVHCPRYPRECRPSRHDHDCELLQLIRLHYVVEDREKLQAIFASLRCLEYDASQARWVWLYTEEARTLPFKDRRAGKNVVLGEFVFKGETDVVLNLRSFDRATNALGFFDRYIPRMVAHVTAMTVSNRLLSTAEAASLGSLDQYFDHAEVVVTDPASLLHDVEELVARTPDLQERFARLDQYLTDRAHAPVFALERLPVHYYEDGIRAVEALLSLRHVRAMHHWQGHTSYTYQDMIRDMLRQGESPTGHPRRVVQEQPSGETPLSTQLGALMRSEAYEDWLHAWELLRDHTPAHLTTFDALERLFLLDVQDCSVTEMLYALDMALHNEGLEDARLTATRAEVARWVYTHFTEESALNLGSFGAMEPSPFGNWGNGAGGSSVSGVDGDGSHLRLGLYLVGGSILDVGLELCVCPGL